MTPHADPYRVLGLVPGSSPGEIRSAYRRLAKLNHPDTAGERPLARFLAIQAAYEELLDDEGRLRLRGWPARGGSGAPRSANPSARGASRDAWRARQGAGTRSGGAKQAGNAGANAGNAGAKQGPGSGAKQGPGSGAKTAGANAAGAKTEGARTKQERERSRDSAKAGAGPKTGRSSSRPGRTRTKTADRRTARPGSTTYDEAAQPLDPSWEGGSWYGASSGRYWTLNPREYADPRKHGPEYQERARRAASLEARIRAKAAEAAAPETDGVPSRSTQAASSQPSSPPPAASPPVDRARPFGRRPARSPAP